MEERISIILKKTEDENGFKTMKLNFEPEIDPNTDLGRLLFPWVRALLCNMSESSIEEGWEDE